MFLGPRVLLALVFLTASLACSRSAPPRGETGDVVASASAAAPAPPPSRAGEPAWERARGGDALDLARLAEAEGASGLAGALRDPDPELAALALAALPRAPDREIALGPLCAEAARRERGRVERVLEVAWAVSEALPPGGERLDPEGLERCAAELPALARDARLPPRPRALALSTLRALAARGLTEPPPRDEAFGLEPLTSP